jgi:hypothetical protein
LIHPNSPWEGGELPPEALLVWTKLREQMSHNANIRLPDAHLPYHLMIQMHQGSNLEPLSYTVTLTQNEHQNLLLLLARYSQKPIQREKELSPKLQEMELAYWDIYSWDIQQFLSLL